MTVQTDNRRQEIITKLRAYLKSRVSEKQATLIETLAHRYYASAPLEDLNERPIEDLFGALVSHWNFIYQRAPGETKIRVFNPS